MSVGKPKRTIFCHPSVFKQLMDSESVDWSINSRGHMMGRVDGCAILVDDCAKIESVKRVLRRAHNKIPI
jgi:hypothetical protein